MIINELPLNKILKGDCIEVMESFPEESVDLIFADPPYNLQLKNDLHRPDNSLVNGVNDNWDKFESFQDYDDFSRKWLYECRRILKPTGGIWVIGSYHNIFRVGSIMQDLSFWILNDVIWVKTNPMPNFRGVRFTNSHETLIWASRQKGDKYTFNYQAMKMLNDGKQMRSDWWIESLATGKERIRDTNGEKAHSTQKPEGILYRAILSSSNPGDVVLDPFFGTGTTGAVAKKLYRNWIGIEKEEKYIKVAQERIDSITPPAYDNQTFEVRSKSQINPRVGFSKLVENGYLQPGQRLYFMQDEQISATIKPDSQLRLVGGFEGSIHQAGKYLIDDSPCNGWEKWFVQENDSFICLDSFRQKYLLETDPGK